MHNYLRIGGGVLLLVGLFMRPMRWDGGDSAFQWAAHRDSFEAIALFFTAMAMGLTAAISQMFARRVVEWLEMLLTIGAILGVIFFVARFGDYRSGLRLSWPGVMMAGGMILVAIGAHGRYRNAGRE